MKKTILICALLLATLSSCVTINKSEIQDGKLSVDKIEREVKLSTEYILLELINPEEKLIEPIEANPSEATNSILNNDSIEESIFDRKTDGILNFENESFYTKYGKEYDDDKFICCSELDGSKAVQLTDFDSEIKFLYDEYVYYYDSEYVAYRMKLDGSGKEKLNIDGYFGSVAGDFVLYWKDNCLWKNDLSEGTRPKLVYEIPFEDDSRSASHIDGFNNTDEYFVLSYTNRNTSGVKVMDFDGNSINEIVFDKDQYGNSKFTNFICILDNYVYFKYQNDDESIYRFYYDKGGIEKVSI